MGVQMFSVSPLVCGGFLEIQTTAWILMKFCTHIPHLPKKGFGEGLTPAPSPLAWGALNTKS